MNWLRIFINHRSTNELEDAEMIPVQSQWIQNLQQFITAPTNLSNL